MIDREEAKVVDIYIDSKNKLWININGFCSLRVGCVEHINLNVCGIKFSPIEKVSSKEVIK